MSEQTPEQLALIDEETTEDELTELVEETQTEEAATEETTEALGEEIVVVQIGDQEPETPSPEEEKSNFVKMRERLRQVERENRELKHRSNPEIQALGKKPSLSDPDIDYDEDKLAAKLSDYIERERKIKEKDAQVAEEQRKQDEAWQKKLAALGDHKASLNVPDYSEAESVVQEVLSDKQQAIIVKGAKNPALVFYALGKNPKKAKELAAMTDLVEYAFAVATLETQLILKKTKAAPPAPELRVAGSGSKSGSMDSHLEKLEAEADRTGDRTKVAAYRREQKQKAA